MDIGKNFASREFNQYAATMGTRLKIVPVKAYYSIGIVERYYAPIRRVYSIITSEIRDLEPDMALQIAFKAINNTAGPDGLVPTLLVYGAYPQITEHNAPSPTVTQRVAVVKKAIAALEKLRAQRQVADALCQRNGPVIDDIWTLMLNSDVLV